MYIAVLYMMALCCCVASGSTIPPTIPTRTLGFWYRVNNIGTQSVYTHFLRHIAGTTTFDPSLSDTSWDFANTTCITKYGARLLTLNTQQELNHFNRLVPRYHCVWTNWICRRDDNCYSRQGYTWPDGTPADSVTYDPEAALSKNYALAITYFLNGAYRAWKGYERTYGQCGFICEAPDPCSSAPCAGVDGTVCTYMVQSGAPRHACKLAECDAGTCRNSGSCVADDGGYSHSCECADGYTGLVCESEVDECASNPCDERPRNHCSPPD